jgi:hypothetical protein
MQSAVKCASQRWIQLDIRMPPNTPKPGARKPTGFSYWLFSKLSMRPKIVTWSGPAETRRRIESTNEPASTLPVTFLGPLPDFVVMEKLHLHSAHITLHPAQIESPPDC